MSEWDSYASDWDDDPAATAYAQAAFSSVIPVVEQANLALSNTRVLDFGCGTGLLTERLVDRGASVMAVDTSQGMLDVFQAKMVDRGWNDVRSSTELPTTLASFDLIVCSSVCSFLDDYPATVQAMAGLLVPGGFFVQWDWERDDDGDAEDPEDAHGLSRAEITDALQSAGLEHVSVDVGFEAVVEDQVMRPLMGHGRRSTN